jgi:tRNA threonylcarbamoyladenosine biosynthesis protein TsaB
MFLLAIDTTTRWASVAVLRDGAVAGELRLFAEAGQFSCWLFPAIESLLRSLGAAPLDVEGYAVAVGPGSFTGVRVGVSTVQGLALASGRPCLGVTTLEALAGKMRGAAPVLVPLMDAYRDQVFAAEYDGDLRQRQAPEAFAPAALLDQVPPGAALLGDGVGRYLELIRERRPDVLLPERSLFLAASVGRLAAPRLAAGEGVDAASLRPFYLRTPDIRPAAPAR